jgi:sensor histidine kinase YesM
MILFVQFLMAQPEDSAIHQNRRTIIAGKLLKPMSDSLKLRIDHDFALWNYLYPNYRKKTTINENGEFRFEFMLDKARTMELRAYNNKQSYLMVTIQLSFVLEPGDSIYFKCQDRFYKNTIEFSGSKAYLHNYMTNHNLENTFSNITEKLITSDEYKSDSSVVKHHIIRKGQQQLKDIYDLLFYDIEKNKVQLGKFGYHYIRNVLNYTYGYRNFYLLGYCTEGRGCFGSKTKCQINRDTLCNIIKKNIHYYGFTDTIPINLQHVVYTEHKNRYIDAYVSYILKLANQTTIPSYPFGSKEKYYMGRVLLEGDTEYAYLARLLYQEALRGMRFYQNAIMKSDFEGFMNDFFTNYPDRQNTSELSVIGDFYKSLQYKGKAFDFTLPDASGEKTSLSDFHGKNIYIQAFAYMPEELKISDVKFLQELNNQPEIRDNAIILILYDQDNIHTFSDTIRDLGENIKILDTRQATDLITRLYIFAGIQKYGLLIDKSGHFIRDDQNFRSQRNNNPTSRIQQIVQAFKQAEKKIDKGYNKVVISILLSLIITLSLSFLIYRYRTKEMKKKDEEKRYKTELELRAIRSQLNPHFMFNALTAIQNLVNKQEVKQANFYLGKFSTLMRHVLDHANQQFIPLTEEIRGIQLYCELESLRYNFDYEITVEEGLDTFTREIPTMLLQPFIENAVIHGISNVKEKGKILVSISEKEGNLHFVIEDNGPGIADKSDNKKNNGYGIKLSQERLKLLNFDPSEKNSVKMLNMADIDKNQHGTRVEIDLTYEL